MRSISSGEGSAPVELVVQANFGNLNLLPDVLAEWRLSRQRAGGREESALGSKIQIIVLGPDRRWRVGSWQAPQPTATK
jgi:hypothetical protein